MRKTAVLHKSGFYVRSGSTAASHFFITPSFIVARSIFEQLICSFSLIQI